MVGGADIERLMAAARRYAERDGRTLAAHEPHRATGSTAPPASADPLGMAGKTLAPDLHAVTADDAPLRNLLHVVERAYLSVVRRRAGALRQRAGRDDRGGAPAGRDLHRHRCGHNDPGDVRAKAICCRVDGGAVGGNHVTFDIAQALSTPFTKPSESRRLYGTLARARRTIRRTVLVPLPGEEEASLHQTTKADIHGIVRQPHVAPLRPCRRAHRALRRRALCRAAHGADRRRQPASRAGRVCGRILRAGRARVARRASRWTACRRMFASPAFSTAVGLVSGRARSRRWHALGAGSGAEARPAICRRMGQWLRESF